MKQTKLYLVAYGIKKRCRKSERHSFTLGFEPESFLNDTASHELAIERARTKLGQEMKTVERSYLDLLQVEIKHELGMQIMTYAPFSSPRVTLTIAGGAQ